MSGFLLKQSDKNDWTKRWFVLNEKTCKVSINSHIHQIGRERYKDELTSDIVRGINDRLVISEVLALSRLVYMGWFCNSHFLFLACS